MTGRNTAVRFHDLDALRGFALLLGVFLHATLSYLPGFEHTGWPIVSESSSAALAVLYFVVHLFRMPVFFLLAGFFGRMQFRRMQPGEFLRARSKRILLPLVFGIVLVAPMNVAVIAAVVGLDASSTSLLPTRSIVPIPLAHLWFLWVLFWFCAAVVLADRVVAALRGRRPQRTEDSDSHGRPDRVSRGRAEQVLGRLTRCCGRGADAVLLGAPVAVCLMGLDQWHLWEGLPTPNTDLVPQPPTLVGYAVAFVFGWFLHRRRDLLAIWRRRWPAYLAAAVVVTAAVAVAGGIDPESSLVSSSQGQQLEPLTGGTLVGCAFGYAWASWLWTLGVLGAAMAAFGRFSPRRRYLADASYWIYIVHMPFIMALQAVVMHWPVSWWVTYPLILLVSVPLLLASYHFLVRSTWIGAMLNGRRYPRSLPVDPASCAVDATSR